MQNWQTLHGEIIKKYLQELNQTTAAFILKGGTSLKQCYNLNRFSEDIDLDSTAKNIIPFTQNFCRKNKYECRIAKNTSLVKRCLIKYQDDHPLLKIEVSYRKRTIPAKDVTRINGITVYTIDKIAQMKAIAYAQRDKIRDLYDITFICQNYYDKLTDATKDMLAESLSHKGLEEFDYLLQTQKDPLINQNKLTQDFLETMDKLGVLYEEDDLMQEKKKRGIHRKNTDKAIQRDI